MSFTGKHLIAMGYKPGPWFKDALAALEGRDPETILDRDLTAIVEAYVPAPKIQMRGALDNYQCKSFLVAPANADEQANETAVLDSMAEIMRVPTVVRAAIMPDACPAGTIPVGGVVATRDAIHPGYHSSDVCCSMAITVLRDQHDPKDLLDLIQKVTHFGPTKRTRRPIEISNAFLEAFYDNPFLTGLEGVARDHFTTQGDGNHFYYVGHLESTGELAIVSHHGSRGFGAQIYKRGMDAAVRETAKIAENIPKGHAWLDTNTRLGNHYWSALHAARTWTKMNHFAMHNLIVEMVDGDILDRFWNPHNFVFQKDDLWMHAKGATPSYARHSLDDSGRTLIPMNMAEPILITEHTNIPDALGFAPHGAGRNMSRTQFMRENTPEHPEGIDARFWCGIPDPSELPAAYKSAKTVTDAIKKHQLAKIVDRVMPYGSIMAGDWEQEAPWRKNK